MNAHRAEVGEDQGHGAPAPTATCGMQWRAPQASGGSRSLRRPRPGLMGPAASPFLTQGPSPNLAPGRRPFLSASRGKARGGSPGGARSRYGARDGTALLAAAFPGAPFPGLCSGRWHAGRPVDTRPPSGGTCGDRVSHCREAAAWGGRPPTSTGLPARVQQSSELWLLRDLAPWRLGRVLPRAGAALTGLLVGVSSRARRPVLSRLL